MTTDSSAHEARQQCADALTVAAARATSIRAFVGLDGFVDEIVHLVATRHDADRYDRIRTIGEFSARVAEAAGRSTNIEPVTQRVKLGGNGPIMANALAAFGVRVTYLGALGWPHVHPVFDALAARSEVYSIAEPGRTTALEFEDGKVMLTNSSPVASVSWECVVERYGRERFQERFASDDFVAFVNWTMIPHMSELWRVLQSDLCPRLTGPRRKLFVDLADPQKRRREDIRDALELVSGFERWFDVILGLNEKEAGEIAGTLGLPEPDGSREALRATARAIAERVPVGTLVVHPVRHALAISGGELCDVDGPFIASPKITTGAGDHFNAGFCFGQLLGLTAGQSLLCGVSTSGHYVRTACSPSVDDLIVLLRNWPQA